MSTPQDETRARWGAEPPKKKRVEEDKGLSPRCTYGWERYKSELKLKRAGQFPGGHPLVLEWLASAGVSVEQLKVAGVAPGEGGLPAMVGVGIDKGDGTWGGGFLAGWRTNAHGRQERSRAPAVIAPLLRVVKGRLADAEGGAGPNAVWVGFCGADETGKAFKGRVTLEGLKHEVNGFVDLFPGAWREGAGEKILLVTDDVADAAALTAATGLPAVAWVGDFDKLTLPDEGRLSVGPRGYQVRAVVLCGAVEAGGKGKAEKRAVGDGLGIRANELLGAFARVLWDVEGERMGLQASAVVPTPEVAGDVLERTAAGGVVLARGDEDGGVESAAKRGVERVGWAYVWRHLVAAVGEDRARVVVTGAVLSGVDREATRYVPAAWEGGGDGAGGRKSDDWAHGGGGGIGGGGGGVGGGGRVVSHYDGGESGGGGGSRWQSEITIDDYGHLIMPVDQIKVAREFIWSKLVRRGVMQFPLKNWGGKVWMSEGPAFAELEGSGDQCIERMIAQVQHWLSGFWKKRPRAGKSDDELASTPYAPTREFCGSVVRAILGECWLSGVDSLPAYMPDDLTVEGDPHFGAATALFGRGAAMVAASQGKPDPRGLIVGRDGMIDLVAVSEGGGAKVRLLRHDPSLFNTTALPFDLPVAELTAALAATAKLDDDEFDLVEKMVEDRAANDTSRVKVDEATLAAIAEERFARLEPIFAAAAPDAWPFLKGLASREEEGGQVVVNTEKLNLICEIIGDAVDKDRTIEKIPLFIGRRRAGKDTLADLIGNMVGERNTVELTVASFDDRFGLYPVMGKQIVFVREMHKGNKNDGTAFVEGTKLLSGNSRVTMRDLYAQAVSVRPGARLIMFANDPPIGMRDQSGAWAGRLVPVKLHRNYYGREDGRVKQRVAADGRGALVVALYFAVRLRRKPVRKFDMSAESEAMRMELERSSAAVAAFVLDCCTIRAGDAVVFGTLYNAYRWYCDEKGQEPKSRGNFSTLLESHVPHFARGQEGIGMRRCTIKGIALTPEALEEMDQAKRERQQQAGPGGNEVQGAWWNAGGE